MKKNFTVKLLSLVFIFLLLLSMITVTAYAEEEFVDWEMNESCSEIYNSDGKIFYRYSENLSSRFKIFPMNIYMYENTVYVPDTAFSNQGKTLEDEWFVYSYAADGEIVLIASEAGNVLYATSKGSDMIQAFREGTDEYYFVTNVTEIGQISHSFYRLISQAIQGYPSKQVGLSRLDGHMIGTLVSMNKSKSIKYEYGYIFYYSDEYYYLNYADVPDTAFDENGQLKLTSVLTKVDLYKIEDAGLDYLNEALDNMVEETPKMTYEGGYNFDLGIDMDEIFDLPASAFWMTFVVLGGVIPLGIAVFGFIMANSRKRGRPGYWISLSISAAAWAFIALVVMILILI